MWSLVLGNNLTSINLTPVATILAWLFLVIEFPRLKTKQRPLIFILLFLGSCCTATAWLLGSDIKLLELLDEHLKLAMLLTAVSFISLAASPKKADCPKGSRSFIHTLLGMHFFSSVANFSAVIVVGDQLNRNNRLDSLSFRILSRGFSLAVLWSPFLSITPLVLEQVPDAQVSTLYPFTIGLAIAGLLLTLLDTKIQYLEELSVYQGFPMKPATLTLPLLLICSVLILNQIYPTTPTVFLVSGLAVLVPACIILLAQGVKVASNKILSHINYHLADSRTEISLFLSAGLLAASVKACIATGIITLPFNETNASIAALTLVMIVVVAFFGLHQLAAVAIFSGLLAEATTTPNLMAIAYILGTGLSMLSSTFSATNFILRLRYNAENRDIIKHQGWFTLIMLVIGIGVIYLMAAMGIK